jgi:cephalosporin-C deacetylase
MRVGPPLAELEKYAPGPNARSDFEQFWSSTLNTFLTDAVKIELTQIHSSISAFDTYDVTVAGYNQDPIKGWFIKPKIAPDQSTTAKVPCVVMYDGYGGGRGLLNEWLFWPSAGYAILVMDTRGQGASGWRVGDTPDGNYPRASQTPGFMTAGILNRDDYYYRRVFTDAVAFVRAAAQIEGIDASRIITAGGSQGGGIALAAASLSNQVFATIPDVPFLCHFEHAVNITDSFPYQEIVQYCKTHRLEVERVFETLSYFDCMNLVTKATAPAFISVGLHDPICPPETIFAMINNYAGPTTIQTWAYNTHEGGSVQQQLLQADWLNKLIGASS